MKQSTIMRHTIIFVIALLLAVIFFQPALALGTTQADSPPLTLPPELIAFARLLVIGVASWLTYQIVEGAKKYVPWLSGSAAQFAAVVTATLLSSFDQLVLLVNNLLGTVTDPYLTILIRTVIFALLAWIGSQGVFLTEKRKAAVPSVITELIATESKV